MLHSEQPHQLRRSLMCPRTPTFMLVAQEADRHPTRDFWLHR
jgi:hypothetical protein